MRKAILAAAVAATTIGWVPLATAQTSPSSSVMMHGRTAAPVPPRVQTPGQAQDNGPTFNLFGLPTYVTTPVAAPYANSAYQNYGGQPQRSSDSLFEAGTRGP